MFLHYRLVTSKETVSAFGGVLTPAILRELIRDRWVKLFSITLPYASYALTSSESLKHRRAITGALAGRTCIGRQNLRYDSWANNYRTRYSKLWPRSPKIRNEWDDSKEESVWRKRSESIKTSKESVTEEEEGHRGKRLKRGQWGRWGWEGWVGGSGVMGAHRFHSNYGLLHFGDISHMVLIGF